ncbi:hypothetical protein Hanom_Chr00s006047g01732091 [Helianthus anomalus]
MGFAALQEFETGSYFQTLVKLERPDTPPSMYRQPSTAAKAQVRCSIIQLRLGITGGNLCHVLEMGSNACKKRPSSPLFITM